MTAAPPVGNGNGHCGEDHAKGVVLVRQPRIVVAHADGHLGQILSYLQLTVEFRPFHVLLQQPALHHVGRGSRRLLAQVQGQNHDAVIGLQSAYCKGRVFQTDILPQHHLALLDAVLHLKHGRLRLVHLQLHLKQVVAQGDSRTDRCLHVFLQREEHLPHLLERTELLL